MLKLLSPNERWDSLIDVLKEIKLITGAILHTGSDLKAQVKVIERFLISAPRFAALTVNEILHAFYLNNQGEFGEVYRHYNKELNGEFIGDVLMGYLRFKDSIYDRVNVKKLLDPPPPPPRHARLTEDELKAYIQEDYNIYRYGENEPYYSILKYNVLRKTGLIEIFSKQYWDKMYRWAMRDRMVWGNGRPANHRDHQERDERMKVALIYKTFREEGYIPVSEHYMVMELIRKKLYLRFFSLIAGCAINDIFNEIEHR